MSRGLGIVALLLMTLAPVHGGAQEFDWEVDEAPAGAPVTALRNARDGVVGLFDAVLDLQLGLFAEVSMLLGSTVMLGSDVVGLVDDNPVTQYVFKGVASKSLAKTAYLLHLNGAEAVLGSHGLEAEWYLDQAFVELNPLLDPDRDGPRVPLDPMAFVGEGMVHTDVYTVRIPGSLGLATIASDAVLRPLGSTLRIFSLTGPADASERLGNSLVRRAVY